MNETDNPSVRAYRMHFDEWGMKKYKATRRRNTARSRHLSSPPTTTPVLRSHTISAVTSTPGTSIYEMGEMRSESEPIPESRVFQQQSHELADILASINHAYDNSLEILQTIFACWHPSPEHNATVFRYFEDPNFNKWVPQHSSHDVPAVFHLIEQHVPEWDRFMLTQSLLEADLSTRGYPDHHSSSWQESWYQACDAREWEEARDLLYDTEVLKRSPSIFQDCALVVLAERLLEGYMRELQDWTGRPLDEEEMDARDECVKKYQEILNNFDHAKQDVRPDFYRSILRFGIEDEWDRSPRNKTYEDEYRLKYIHLLCAKTSRESRLLLMPVHTPDLAQRQQSQSHSYNILPPTPPTPNDLPVHHFTTSVSPLHILEDLRRRWRALDDFSDYLTSLIHSGNQDVSIFTPRSRSSPMLENLFELIFYNIAEESERISLTKAILLVASITDSPKSQPCSRPILLDWWTALFNLPPHLLTYQTFYAQLLNNARLEYDLDQVVSSSQGKSLFMDAAVALVGERLLDVLKAGLRSRGGSQNGRGKDNSRSACREGFSNVLGVMRERGVKVDPGWTTVLLDST